MPGTRWARVVAEFGGQRLLRQITAGDGYHASNQKQLVFGLGEAASVDALSIHWPGGEQQTFESIPANQTIVVQQGDDRVWPVSHGSE